MSTLHLLRKNLYLMIETRLFRRFNTYKWQKKVFVKGKGMQGVITDTEYLSWIQKVIEKGYINVTPINDVYSKIKITKPFQDLADHYGRFYDKEVKQIDFEMHFDQIIDKKDLLAKRDLSGKNMPHTNHLWRFKYNHYYLGYFHPVLKEIIKRSTPDTLIFTSMSFHMEEKVAIVSFISQEFREFYVNLAIYSDKFTKPLKNYKAFRTIDFIDVSSLERAIKRFLHSIQKDKFNHFKYGDFIQHKILSNFILEGKIIAVPHKQIKNNISHLKEMYVIDIKTYSFIERIEDELTIKRLIRAVSMGLAAVAKIDERFSRITITETARILHHELMRKFSYNFLEDIAADNLPEGYLCVETWDKYKMVLQNLQQAGFFLGSKLLLL